MQMAIEDQVKNNQLCLHGIKHLGRLPLVGGGEWWYLSQILEDETWYLGNTGCMNKNRNTKLEGA